MKSKDDFREGGTATGTLGKRQRASVDDKGFVAGSVQSKLQKQTGGQQSERDKVVHSVDDDELLTLQDYVSRCEEEERLAQAVLRYRDDECTYAKGYATQKIYGCVTCYRANGKFCGICYSCSINCHTSHHLEELDPRLGFRCDCPTNASDVACSFNKGQDDQPANVHNLYNDNFKGVYCSCKQAYDFCLQTQTMLFCQICQDWFHESCLGGTPDLDAEPIKDNLYCYHCIKRYPRLLRHAATLSDFCVAISDTGETLDLTGEDTACDVDVVSDKTAQSGATNCSIETAPGEKAEAAGTTGRYNLFFTDNFELCKCDSCFKYAEDNGIVFLLKPFPVVSYEEDESIKQPVDYDRMFLEALHRLERPKAINAVEGYLKLKEKLREFLKGQEGKVITTRQIAEFMECLRRS